MVSIGVMEGFQFPEKVFLRYLLNELSEEEVRELEFHIFQSEVVYQQFLIFEDELIDRYLYSKELFSVGEIKKIALQLTSPKYTNELRFRSILNWFANEEYTVGSQHSANQLRWILLEFRKLFNVRYELTT
jgi:hypothetical protein